MRAARIRGGYLVRFPRLAEFRILGAGRRIEGRPLRGNEADDLRHLLLDHILPYALSLQGNVVLHAGAVAVRGRAVVFMGETGSGKSTLCASFMRSEYELLTDDGLLLQRQGSRWYCVPSYPGIRLWRDSFKRVCGGGQRSPVAGRRRKRRVPLKGTHVFARRRWRIHRIFFLGHLHARRGIDPKRSVHIEVQSPHEAMLALIRQSFRLDLKSHKLARGEFKELSHLAAQKIVRTLRYPRIYELLPRVRKAVTGDL